MKSFPSNCNTQGWIHIPGCERLHNKKRTHIEEEIIPSETSTTEDVNTILIPKSFNQSVIMLFEYWVQSVFDLNRFYETQNKIGPDFKIESASLSPELINSCINAETKQETPTHKELTYLLDIRLNKCFHFMLYISGVSCTKLGTQRERDSESPKKVFTKKKKKNSSMLTWNEFHILSVLRIIFIFLHSSI